MTRTLVTAIVSTALPGAPRGALDAAIELGLGHGGWRAADLEVPEIYAAHQRTTTSPGLAARLNVQDSDGTLIVTAGPPPLDGRARFVAEACQAQRKPAKHIQLTAGDRTRVPDAVRAALLAWIDDNHVSVLHVAGDVELQDATRDLLVWLLEDDHAAAAQGFDRVQSIADICGRPMNGFDAAAAVASGEVAERVIADAVEQRLEAYRAAATELASNRIDPASLQHVPFTPARFAALAANVYANGCRHVAGECMHCQVRICIECREPLDLPSDAEIKTAVIWCREHVHLDPSRPGALPPGPREVWAPRDRLHSVSIDATGALTVEAREGLAASIEHAVADIAWSPTVFVTDAPLAVKLPPPDQGVGAPWRPAPPTSACGHCGCTTPRAAGELCQCGHPADSPPVHLWMDRQDREDPEVWCGVDGAAGHSDVASVTCKRCLGAAAAFGDRARDAIRPYRSGPLRETHRIPALHPRRGDAAALGSWTLRLYWKPWDDGRVGWVDFELFEVTALAGAANELEYPQRGATRSTDVTSSLDEAEPTAQGFLKWDGCTQFSVEPVHVDGRGELENLFHGISEARRLAAAAMPATYDKDSEYP